MTASNWSLPTMNIDTTAHNGPRRILKRAVDGTLESIEIVKSRASTSELRQRYDEVAGIAKAIAEHERELDGYRAQYDCATNDGERNYALYWIDQAERFLAHLRSEQDKIKARLDEVIQRREQEREQMRLWQEAADRELRAAAQRAQQRSDRQRARVRPQRNVRRSRRVVRVVAKKLAAKSTADPGDSSSDPPRRSACALTDITVCSRGAL